MINSPIVMTIMPDFLLQKLQKLQLFLQSGQYFEMNSAKKVKY